MTKDKLYGISYSFDAVKEEMELHLKKRTNELFDLDDKIIFIRPDHPPILKDRKAIAAW
jgi:hypothetical protein